MTIKHSKFKNVRPTHLACIDQKLFDRLTNGPNMCKAIYPHFFKEGSIKNKHLPGRSPQETPRAPDMMPILTLSLPSTTTVPYANSLDPDETQITQHLSQIQAV